MGIDDTQDPAEQYAAGADGTAPDHGSDEQPVNTGSRPTSVALPAGEEHTDEWIANASKAGAKIKAMFRS